MSFTVRDISDVIHTELGLTMNKRTLEAMFNRHLKKMFKIMSSKRDRIIFRECDIHTIYTKPNVKELCGRVADVDETKELEFPKNFAMRGPKTRDPHRAHRRGRKKIAGRWDLIDDFLNA